MKILAIDSSCDEPAGAIVENGKNVISSLTRGQIDVHKAYDGVVPELAARKHLEALFPLVDMALNESKMTIDDIDAFAVTNRPGLVGSLLVGVGAAKACAFAMGKPLIAIDHLAAHIYSTHLTNEIVFPYIALIISGGHTLLCYVRGQNDYEVKGTTLDDAVGEAYDKVAKHLGLGYPGGPVIDRRAHEGNPDAIRYPLVMLDGKNTYNFSYSGLKTAVVYQTEQFLVEGHEASIENIAASFQKSAVDVLYKKTMKLVKALRCPRVSVSGGVAANSYVRSLFASSDQCSVYLPERRYATDNAAMVGGLAYHIACQGSFASLDLDCHSRALFKMRL